MFHFESYSIYMSLVRGPPSAAPHENLREPRGTWGEPGRNLGGTWGNLGEPGGTYKKEIRGNT